MSASTKSAQAGFTIVELLVTISMIGLIAVTFFAVITNYLAIITRNSTLNELTIESQNLLRSTVEELRYGAGVRQTNTVFDANQPGSWNTSNTNFVIIIAVPAVDASNTYIINPDTGSPYNNELVYYRDNKKLFKRMLANPNAVGNQAVTTCPPATASSTCPADRLLTSDGKQFSFILYDQDNNATTDPLLGRSVHLDLQLERDTFGEPITFSNSIRVTLRNQF